MITILTGTQNMPFNRLFSGLSKGWEDLRCHGPVVIQAGSTVCQNIPDWVSVFDFCDKGKIEELLRDSEFCITHGGVGSIIGALTAGCKVAVMPRLKSYREHNDDHQVEIAELFDAAGLVVYWRDTMSIHDVLCSLKRFNPKPYKSEFADLRHSIEMDVNEFLGGSR